MGTLGFSPTSGAPSTSLAFLSLVGAGPFGESQIRGARPPLQPDGVTRLENESDLPKAFLQVPTAGRRALRLLPQQASQPGLAFLGPCPPITRTSLSSPRHSALCHLHGPGAGELSLCPLPVTTGASVPLSASPGGAAWGPWFGDLGGTPGPQVGTRWNSEKTTLPIGPRARVLGHPRPIQLQSNINTLSARTPHSGAATLLSQPHWHAGRASGQKPSSMSWLLCCARRWRSCSENKGPEAPAEQRKAESSGFQSLLTVARVRKTPSISSQCAHNGFMLNK